MADNNFTKNWREARDADAADAAEAEQKEFERKQNITNYNELIDDFVAGYKDWLKNPRGAKQPYNVSGNRINNKIYSEDDETYTNNLKQRVRDMVIKAADEDGTLKKDANGNYDEGELAEYGTNLINSLETVSRDSNDTRRKYTETWNDAQKEAVKKFGNYVNDIKLLEKMQKEKGAYGGSEEAISAMKRKLENDMAEYGDQIKRGKELMTTGYDNYVAEQNGKNRYDIFENYESYSTSAANRNKNKKDSSKSGDSKSSGSSSDSSDSDTVEFTLTRGNDPNYKGFGQKIVDLGLATSNGLWGENGDVAYYTKQLNDQGIYGNLPIGKKITLKRRK